MTPRPLFIVMALVLGVATATAQPVDTAAALARARSQGWSGDIDAAATGYWRVLRADPEHADAWLELARVESWRGNTPGALAALEQYRRRFGRSRAYTLLRAQVLSGGGRAGAALDLVDPIVREEPDDYEAALQQSLALTAKRQLPSASRALDRLRQLDGVRVETKQAATLYRTYLGSTVEPMASFYSDSDHIEITRVAPGFTVRLHTGTQLGAGYERQVLRAPQRNGLGQSSGRGITAEQAWALAGQQLGPLTITGRVGAASAGSIDHAPWTIGGTVRASDAFTASVERADEFFLVSPKTAELALTQTRYRAELAWTPAVRATVAVSAQYQELSDGNRRWEAVLSPRVAVLRSRWLNLDVGATGLQLGADRDLPNGYYDPARYQAFLGVVYPYLKLSENVGVGVTLGLGGQRQASNPFRFGGTMTTEASIGIYQAWLLRVSAAVTHNQRLETGAFDGYTGGVALVRRF